MKHLIIIFSFLLFSCSQKQQEVDFIYFNGNIITMNDSMPEAEVIIINDQKIIQIGDASLLSKFICKKENLIDLKKQFVYPGFIDAHCHFYGYAKTLLNCDLVGTKSWDEVLNRLKTFSDNSESEWLIGRGWDQNDWQNQTFPENSKLNELFPNQPVILQRIDGHAAICNNKALEIAGINAQSQIAGGEIILKNNIPTGVLLDNAVDLVKQFVKPHHKNDIIRALKQAEKNCFESGLTSLADAGLDIETALFLDSLYQQKDLSISQYIMLNPTENGLLYAQEKGEYETDFLKICSFKLYADGALGSRGAKLKNDYCDRDQHSGLLLNSRDYFEKWCSDISKTTYQVNTHCIGDSANRLLLEIYGQFLKGKNDQRWRIEHAQVIDPNDFDMFAKYSIIPSVQPTHATSDGPWVEHRLCKHRLKGAYAYQTLLNQNGYIPLGTDFPVEGIQPLNTYYSAVFRADINDKNNTQYLADEKLNPLDALKGMTVWAAKSCRLEHKKGQLKAGWDADFVVLSQNILLSNADDFKQTKVLRTVARGKTVFPTNP
jgi:predicted amidohydrolase YtcJ